MKKKVCICAEGLTREGGMSRYVQNLSHGLQQCGWDVTIVTISYRGDLFVDIGSTIRCIDLSDVLPSFRKVHMLADQIGRIAPDVCVFNYTALGHYALPFFPCGVKAVSVIHSDDTRFFESASLCSSRIFRWIAPTPGVADHFRRYVKKSDAERIIVMPHGIRQEIFFFDLQEQRHPVPYAVFIGYLDKNKGAHLLPEIFSRIRDGHPEVIFTIIGDGPMRVKIQDELRDQGLEEKCEFHAGLNDRHVAAILRRSHVLVLPTEVESFGYAIAEAMSCGTVPVVTRLPGITDALIEHQHTGMLVQERTSKDFADAVNFLFKDMNKWRSMSQAAAAFAQRSFSNESHVTKFEQIVAGENDVTASPVGSSVGWCVEMLCEIFRIRPAWASPLQRGYKLLSRPFPRELQ